METADVQSSHIAQVVGAFMLASSPLNLVGRFEAPGSCCDWRRMRIYSVACHRSGHDVWLLESVRMKRPRPPKRKQSKPMGAPFQILRPHRRRRDLI
jgi:hypothetical protein